MTYLSRRVSPEPIQFFGGLKCFQWMFLFWWSMAL